ncbi:MAG: kinase [Thermoplasmatales archaeon]|nr:kinase [Thermoplasmatales archaeon]
MLNRMVMTRAPLRITFVGGGTDLPFYYEKRDYGAVVSSAINKYIYVTVNRKFDSSIRVSYSKTEIVDSVDRIEHPTIRESLRLLGIENGIEIVSISDVPSRGTGLGSSSTFLVALLHALHSYKGEFVSAEELAREAVRIEREILKEEGGKQDQYIAAYGGTNLMKFRSDGSVEIVNAVSHDSNLKKIEKSLLLLYTNRERSSTEIHKDQIENSPEKMNVYDEMKKLTDGTLKAICDGDIDALGELMHRNWMMKRSLSSRISDGWIDEKYERAIKLGANGGKVVGAGGGGFLLLVAEPEKHENIAKELGLRKVDFRFSQSGSRVIFVGE